MHCHRTYSSPDARNAIGHSVSMTHFELKKSTAPQGLASGSRLLAARIFSCSAATGTPSFSTSTSSAASVGAPTALNTPFCDTYRPISDHTRHAEARAFSKITVAKRRVQPSTHSWQVRKRSDVCRVHNAHSDGVSNATEMHLYV